MKKTIVILIIMALITSLKAQKGLSVVSSVDLNRYAANGMRLPDAFFL